MSRIKYISRLSAVLFMALFSISATAAPTPRVKPMAPGPVYVSAKDHTVLENFYKAIDTRKWTTANSLRRSLKDPVARSLADWSFFKSNSKLVRYQDVGAFFDAYPDWPQLSFLQRAAEKKITNASSPDDILAFFDQRDPLSGNGKIQLARAELARGRMDAAKYHIRSAWIDHDWPKTKETEVLNSYGKYLSPEDHIAKADRQLFEIKATNTKRLLVLLPKPERRKAEARIAFLTRTKSAPGLYAKLPPEDQKDAGVLHAVTRYYRRSDNEPTAIGYALMAPKNTQGIRDAGKWWTERRILSRWALKNGRFKEAYILNAFTGLQEGTSFSEAEFTAGWIALRFLNRPERARAHFLYMDQGVSAPISKARAAYWIGRTYSAEGNSDLANRYYAVAAAWPFTYYGQLAMEQIAEIIPPETFPPTQKATADDLAIFNARPIVYAMNVLRELDRDSEFIAFARHLDDQIQTPGELIAYEDMMREEGKLFLSIRAAKVATKSGAGVAQVSYPLVSVPEKAANYVEAPLILGLSRQESEFNPRAYSSARARGLMQMLPSTAKITARKEGIPYSLSGLMDDPQYNMTLGAAHLSHLIERFDGSYIMTLAGYNAGPHRVTRWVGEYGDPRASNIDPVDWVELIPFGETRNYVQRVLENVQIYRAQINDVPLGGYLSTDLVRGGGTATAIGIYPPNPVLQGLSEAYKSQAKLDLPPEEPVALAAAANIPLPPRIGGKSTPVRVVSTPEPKPTIPTVQAEDPVVTETPQLAQEQPARDLTAPQKLPDNISPVTTVPNDPIPSPDDIMTVTTEPTAPSPEGQTITADSLNAGELETLTVPTEIVTDEMRTDDLNRQMLDQAREAPQKLDAEPAIPNTQELSAPMGTDETALKPPLTLGLKSAKQPCLTKEVLPDSTLSTEADDLNSQVLEKLNERSAQAGC